MCLGVILSILLRLLESNCCGETAILNFYFLNDGRPSS